MSKISDMAIDLDRDKLELLNLVIRLERQMQILHDKYYEFCPEVIDTKEIVDTFIMNYLKDGAKNETKEHDR